MFDEKKYQESFSVIHASSNLLSGIQNATDKKRERLAPKAIRIAIVCLALVLIPAVTVFAYNCFESVILCFDGDAEVIEQDIRVVEETAASYMSMSYKESDRTDRNSIGMYLKFTEPKLLASKRPGRA